MRIGLLVGLLLIGCASYHGKAPGVVPEVEAAWRRIEPVPDMALIYVVRTDDSWPERGAAYTVTVAGERGTLDRKGWMLFRAPPGDHVLEGRVGNRIDTVPLRLDAGEVVFLALRMSLSGARFVNTTTEDVARDAISRYSMAWSSGLPDGSMRVAGE